MARAPRAYANGQNLASNGIQTVTKAQQSGRQLLRVRNSDPQARQNPNPRIGHYIWWFGGLVCAAKCMRTKADIELVTDSDALCSRSVSILNAASTAAAARLRTPWLQKSPPAPTFTPCATLP